MGSKTLVDVVSAIWGLASATISAVKSVGEAAWNGIKAGVQFILDAVIQFMIDAMVLSFQSILKVMGIMLSTFLPLNIEITTEGFLLEGKPVRIYSSGKIINIEIFDIVLKISDILYSMTPQFESLSVDAASVALSVVQIYSTAKLMAMATSMSNAPANKQSTIFQMGPSMITFGMSITRMLLSVLFVHGIYSLDTNPDKQDDYARMYAISGIISLLSIFAGRYLGNVVGSGSSGTGLSFLEKWCNVIFKGLSFTGPEIPVISLIAGISALFGTYTIVGFLDSTSIIQKIGYSMSMLGLISTWVKAVPDPVFYFNLIIGILYLVLAIAYKLF